MLAAEVPSPFKGLLRNFNPILTEPQQDNLARNHDRDMLVYEGEKYVNKINETTHSSRTRTRATLTAS
jgi:hypothetical protein